ncbi:MAG: TetR/AcrR family transcriptional regulator [Chitinophagaceae bacterium]
METRERILIKSKELFRLYGIRAVTLDEIANSLGISKKTIYQSFEDKDALVDAVMMDEFDCSYQDCMSCAINSKNAVDEIFILMEHMDEDFRNLNPIVIFDMKKFHFNTFQKFQNHLHSNLTQMVATNLKRGIAEGYYRENLDIEIVSKFRMASTWLLFDQETFPAHKYELSQIFKEVLELFLHGLVNPKGYKLIEKYKEQNNKK